MGNSNGAPQCGDPRFCAKHCEEEVQPMLTEKDNGEAVAGVCLLGHTHLPLMDEERGRFNQSDL